MITFELFSLEVLASNINWIAKTITINKNVKYCHITLNHYLKDVKNDEKKDEKKQINNKSIKTTSYKDIKTYKPSGNLIYNNSLLEKINIK